MTFLFRDEAIHLVFPEEESYLQINTVCWIYFFTHHIDKMHWKMKMGSFTYVCSWPQLFPRKVKKQSMPQMPMLEVVVNHGYNLPEVTLLLHKLSLKNLSKLVYWLIINGKKRDF